MTETMKGRVYHYFLFATLLLTGVAQANLSPKVKVFRSREQEPQVRVRVAQSLSQVSVSGTDLERHFHPNDQQKRFTGRKRIVFKCSLFAQRNNFSHDMLLASIESPTGLISLGDKKYRGQIHVVADSAKRSCDVVNEIRLEQYLSGLLSKEMNAAWPLEALKAQAVAARTYALYKMRKKNTRIFGETKKGFFDLENSERHQVSGTFFDTTVKTDQAVNHTRGEVLVSEKGSMTPIFFHASCGGKTRLPQYVWSNSVDSYSSVQCPYCKKERGKSWSGKLSLARVKSFLKWAHKKGYLSGIENFSLQKTIRLVSSSADNPRLSLYIGDEKGVMNKQTFRRFFGRKLFPSTLFSLNFSDGFWNISGRGNGHGVGMCQVGARSLAKKGLDYHEILQHYFPGHQLTQLY